jgi:hypothetical protein
MAYECPPSFDGLHGNITRSSQFNFVVSEIKGGDFFVLNSIKDWNTLRNNIKAINDHDAFKAAVKQHMKST